MNYELRTTNCDLIDVRASLIFYELAIVLGPKVKPEIRHFEHAFVP
jgi:hypothetical protein